MKRERIKTFQENARENHKKFIENNIRINNNKNIVIITELSKSY